MDAYPPGLFGHGYSDLLPLSIMGKDGQATWEVVCFLKNECLFAGDVCKIILNDSRSDPPEKILACFDPSLLGAGMVRLCLLEEFAPCQYVMSFSSLDNVPGYNVSFICT